MIGKYINIRLLYVMLNLGYLYKFNEFKTSYPVFVIIFPLWQWASYIWGLVERLHFDYIIIVSSNYILYPY